MACGGSHPTPALPAPASETTSAAPGAAADDAQPVAPSAAGPQVPASEPVAADKPHVMPTDCAAHDGDLCTPPSDFVDRLCNGAFLDAALVLFGKGSPWTRSYLAGDVDAWYASGGASARAKLDFDEEVLVLRFRAPAKGAIVVSGSGSYDVLRWDGLCYTLDAGELTRRRPPKPKRPTIPFHHLSGRWQSALLADPHVKAIFARRGKECKGVTQGDVSLACLRADEALSAAVVDFVRSSELPAPEHVP
jgi:hypothetical protein